MPSKEKEKEKKKKKKHKRDSLKNPTGCDEDETMCKVSLIAHPQNNVAEAFLLEKVLVALNQIFCITHLVHNRLRWVSRVQPTCFAVRWHGAFYLALHLTEHIACKSEYILSYMYLQTAKEKHSLPHNSNNTTTQITCISSEC